MSKSAIAILFLLFCFSASAADDKTADSAPPKSAAAIAAQREYDKNIEVAEKAFREAKLSAEKKLMEKLKSAEIIATKTGNLAEANSIDRAVKESEARIDELKSNPDAPKAFKIGAAKDWQPTVQVLRGQEIRIRAIGKWCGNIGDRKGSTVGPDGRSDGWYYLEGRIAGGDAFKVGSLFSLTAPEAGMLELRIHDTAREDNDGALDVGIVLGKLPS